MFSFCFRFSLPIKLFLLLADRSCFKIDILFPVSSTLIIKEALYVVLRSVNSDSSECTLFLYDANSLASSLDLKVAGDTWA